MTKDKLTIGHYASHRNTGDYQPTKSDRPKALNPPKCGGITLPPPPEFFHNISLPISVTSELELRIRKEVLDDVNKMIEYEADEEEYHKSILLRIKDRLNLLWGSNE